MTDSTQTNLHRPPLRTTRRMVLLSLVGAAAGLAAPRSAQAIYAGPIARPDAGAGPQPASRDVTVVDMNNALRFVPDQIRIKAGGTVEWRNVQSFPHSVTADPTKAANPANVALPAGAEPFNSGRIDGGKSWRHTFTVAGVYRYFCIPHEGAGMLGTVIVE